MFPEFAPPKTLTKDEERRLLRVVRSQGSPRDLALLTLALGTGLRLRELRGLNVGDICPNGGSVAWKGVLDPKITKGRRGGVAYLAPAVRAELGRDHQGGGERGASSEVIRSAGVQAGRVLNPATPFEMAVPLRGEVDLSLGMTVHPGFAGQAFRADVLPKIREARRYLDVQRLRVDLQVDGGVKLDTAPFVAQAGADILVSGSGIFPDHVRENLRRIREAAQSAAADRR